MACAQRSPNSSQTRAARDLAVLRHCLGRDIPVAGLIGGGYDRDRHVLARRHGILQHSAAQVWEEFGLV